MTGGRQIPPLTADDLVRLRWAMEPAIDPAGRRLAFVASGPDGDHDRVGYRVQTVDIETGQTAAVDETVRTRLPAWVPPLSALSVLAEIDGRWQVAHVDDAGDLTPLTALPGDVAAYDWSPDGARIACEVALDAGADGRTGGRQVRPGDRQVFVVDVAEGSVRPLLPDHPTDSRAPAWSPDGRQIAVLSDRPGDGTTLLVLDAATPRRAESLAITSGELRAFAWSPDANAIAVLGHPTPAAPWSNTELWVVQLDGGGERRLGQALDRSLGQVVRGDDERGTGVPCVSWSPDGARVLVALADGGSSAISSFAVSVPSAGATGEQVVGGDRAVLEFAVAARGGTIAFTWSDPLTPGEVSIHLSDGSERQCSDLGRRIRERPLAATERITHIADDGQPVEGWLTMPIGPAEPVPLVIQVHGGPHYPVGLRFSFDAQRWAANGIAVLRGNPRGSQGYGVEFAAAIRGDWGGRDYRDLTGLLDEALARPHLDRRRLAIVGESYGGYMAMWAIGRTDRFTAAVSENGVSDLAAAARHDPDFWLAELATAAGEEAPHVTEQSPLTAAATITTPLLAVHAERDAVSLIHQSEAMVATLREHGCAAELLRVPSEGHMVNLFGRPSRRIAKLRRIDHFLVDHLRPAAAHRRSTAPATTPLDRHGDRSQGGARRATANFYPSGTPG